MTEQEELESLHEMFQSPGWAQLHVALEAKAVAARDVKRVETIEQLYQNKGKLEVLEFLQFLPDYVRNQLDDDDAV